MSHSCWHGGGSSLNGYGIERIVFADGSSWDQNDIFANASFIDTEAANSLSGWVERDNIDGAGGNDTIDGNGGDDWLYGGGGNDYLIGDIGSDHYVWTIPSGNDTIHDYTGSLTETDTLILRGVLSSAVGPRR